jgi:hypothetical protein
LVFRHQQAEKEALAALCGDLLSRCRIALHTSQNPPISTFALCRHVPSFAALGAAEGQEKGNANFCLATTWNIEPVIAEVLNHHQTHLGCVERERHGYIDSRNLLAHSGDIRHNLGHNSTKWRSVPAPASAHTTF